MDGEEIAALYLADLREHEHLPEVGTDEYRAMRERGRLRRERVAESSAAGAARAAEDAYRAAWIFNHGDTPADARTTHELATRSRPFATGLSGPAGVARAKHGFVWRFPGWPRLVMIGMMLDLGTKVSSSWVRRPSS